MVHVGARARGAHARGVHVPSSPVDDLLGRLELGEQPQQVALLEPQLLEQLDPRRHEALHALDELLVVEDRVLEDGGHHPEQRRHDLVLGQLRHLLLALVGVRLDARVLLVLLGLALVLEVVHQALVVDDDIPLALVDGRLAQLAADAQEVERLARVLELGLGRRDGADQQRHVVAADLVAQQHGELRVAPRDDDLLLVLLFELRVGRLRHLLLLLGDHTVDARREVHLQLRDGHVLLLLDGVLVGRLDRAWQVDEGDRRVALLRRPLLPAAVPPAAPPAAAGLLLLHLRLLEQLEGDDRARAAQRLVARLEVLGEVLPVGLGAHEPAAHRLLLGRVLLLLALGRDRALREALDEDAAPLLPLLDLLAAHLERVVRAEHVLALLGEQVVQLLLVDDEARHHDVELRRRVLGQQHRLVRLEVAPRALVQPGVVRLDELALAPAVLGLVELVALVGGVVEGAAEGVRLARVARAAHDHRAVGALVGHAVDDRAAHLDVGVELVRVDVLHFLDAEHGVAVTLQRVALEELPVEGVLVVEAGRQRAGARRNLRPDRVAILVAEHADRVDVVLGLRERPHAQHDDGRLLADALLEEGGLDERVEVQQLRLRVARVARLLLGLLLGFAVLALLLAQPRLLLEPQALLLLHLQPPRVGVGGGAPGGRLRLLPRLALDLLLEQPPRLGRRGRLRLLLGLPRALGLLDDGRDHVARLLGLGDLAAGALGRLDLLLRHLHRRLQVGHRAVARRRAVDHRLDHARLRVDDGPLERCAVVLVLDADADGAVGQ